MTAILSARAQKLRDWLAELAAIGEPCPSNEAVKARLGLTGNNQTSELFSHLEQARVITIERGANWRVVTIAATGKSTARPRRAPAPPTPPLREPDIEDAAAAYSRAADRDDPVRRPRDTAKPAAPPEPFVERHAVAALPIVPAAGPATTGMFVRAFDRTPTPPPAPQPVQEEPAVPEPSRLTATLEFRNTDDARMLLLHIWQPERHEPLLTTEVDDYALFDLCRAGAIALGWERPAATDLPA